jgi:hypothetical protein
VSADAIILRATTSVTVQGSPAAIIAVGAIGPQGATGAAGPNAVTVATTTTLSGILSGNGLIVGTATAGTDYATPASVTAAQAAAQAASQPVDSDLTAIAALATTVFGRALLTQADDAATRTTLGLGTAATTAATAYDVAGAAALMLPLAGGTMTGAIVGNKAAGAKFAILPLADSTTAFQVQTAAGANILNVNSTGSAVGIGTTTTSTVSKLVVGPYVTADTLANVHITAIATNHKPLVVQGYTAQTADLQQWQNSVGNYVARVGAAGDFGILYISNPVTTGPYIQFQTTYTRFINRNTITNVPLQVQGMASQTGDLTQWMDSAGTVRNQVYADGRQRISIPSANAAALEIYDANDSTSLIKLGSTGSPYSPRITMTNGITTAGVSIDLLGSSSATSAITAQAALFGNVYTTLVPLVAKGVAAQTADLQQWQDSAGTVLGSMSSAGQFSALGTARHFFNGPIEHSGGGAARLGQGAITRLSVSNTGTLINAGSATENVLRLQGFASQTGDLQQWISSGSVVLSRVNKGGYYMTALNAAPADADVSTSEMAIWFDNTNGASKLMVKAKQADGTVKTASLALA